MGYQWYLVVTPQAREQIDTLPSHDRMLVFQKLIELLNADDPIDVMQVTDIKKLRSPAYHGLWRKRAGNWRILYRLEAGEVTFYDFVYKGQLIVEQVLNRRDL